MHKARGGRRAVKRAIAAALAMALAGCSTTWSLSIELLRRDEATCAADARSLPGCITGVVLHATRDF